MDEAIKTLVVNGSVKIRSLRKTGVTGMSSANLKQITPTKGLRCTPSQYHVAWDEAVKELKSKFAGFIY
jgi:hypothetical protein